MYRGVFGTHVANVIRRLRRICRMVGSNPQFILCSATISNPAEHAERLVGLPFEVVESDGSPLRRQGLRLLEPARDRHSRRRAALHQLGGRADIRRASEAPHAHHDLRPQPAPGRASLRLLPRPARADSPRRRQTHRLVPRQLLARRPSTHRTRPLRGQAARAHYHHRHGAWHRRRYPGRDHPHRLPRLHRQRVATGRTQRTRRRNAPSAPWSPRTTPSTSTSCATRKRSSARATRAPVFPRPTPTS